MIKNLAIALGAAAAVMFLGVAQAHAEESPTAGHGSAGLLLGYGFKDGANFGLGARGGYTLPMNVYLGGTFVYHLGKSESSPLYGDVKANLYYLGFEGGYDIAAGPVVVRPYLGLGPTMLSASIGDVSDTKTYFSLWPGATVLYPLGAAFLGADARVLFVTGTEESVNVFSLFATGGVHF